MGNLPDISKDHDSAGVGPQDQPSRRRLLLAVPAIGFVGLAAVFAKGLTRDPSLIPSALVGKKIPIFDLPPVKGRSLGLSSKNLVGEVSLVNVFASWCVACREEHPLWMNLAAQNLVPVHGLNYKDAPDDASQWLNTLGDPYTRTGADINGRVAIDFGVYGVPETFVVSADGSIAYKHIGAITAQVLSETLLPIVKRLQKSPQSAGT